jgi:hypothetical protein
MYEPEAGIARQNCEFRMSPVWIKDARALTSPPSVHVEGFELWDAPTVVTDITDEDAVRKRYYAEAAELAKYVTGADHAHIFDHQLRQCEAGRPSAKYFDELRHAIRNRSRGIETNKGYIQTRCWPQLGRCKLMHHSASLRFIFTSLQLLRLWSTPSGTGRPKTEHHDEGSRTMPLRRDHLRS